ncbi:30S ribosomal protein S5 [Candidatus Peregrinibacteria bacterium]|nr:30S ribosomal protein S5 [Candidatus Peregrinibacteria bacterium]
MAKKNARKADAHVKEQKEFEEEVLQIDRVTRVVKGGRRLRFRATVAVGDKKGRVGVGVGKASEVVFGIQKAVSKAKASLIKVPITKGDTIPHAVRVKYKASEMIVMPASPGTGVIAGGSLRKVLHLAGVKNVLSKNVGSRNTLVTAQAAIKALKALRPVKASQMKKFEEEKPKNEERVKEENAEKPKKQRMEKKAKTEKTENESQSKETTKK